MRPVWDRPSGTSGIVSASTARLIVGKSSAAVVKRITGTTQFRNRAPKEAANRRTQSQPSRREKLKIKIPY